MDYCLLVFSSVVSVLFLISIIRYFRPSQPARTKATERRRSFGTQNRSSDSPKSARKVVEMHDVQELKHLSMTELEQFNVQFCKFTDRYWREIFRRQNDSHHPDQINVSRLQTSNIITALDENLPPGALREITVIGLVPKPFSSRKCEVMRYLRDRLTNSPDVELTFKGDHLRITAAGRS
ncbi:unnamed protein product [Caenorhabditis sp. 36 PRJEB53466]|nr:unnamed protein product [Caenorhabditis sp. 36 PRJEB53466]